MEYHIKASFVHCRWTWYYMKYIHKKIPFTKKKSIIKISSSPINLSHLTLDLIYYKVIIYTGYLLKVLYNTHKLYKVNLSVVLNRPQGLYAWYIDWTCYICSILVFNLKLVEPPCGTIPRVYFMDFYYGSAI